MFKLYVCLCTSCMPGVLGYYKRESDSLELKLQMILNFYVIVGIKPGSSGNTASVTSLRHFQSL